MHWVAALALALAQSQPIFSPSGALEHQAWAGILQPLHVKFVVTKTNAFSPNHIGLERTGAPWAGAIGECRLVRCRCVKRVASSTTPAYAHPSKEFLHAATWVRALVACGSQGQHIRAPPFHFNVVGLPMTGRLRAGEFIAIRGADAFARTSAGAVPCRLWQTLGNG